MPEAAETAGALFRAGKLRCGDRRRQRRGAPKAPAISDARVLLAELLLFAGNLERADVILDAASTVDPTSAIVVAEFRQLIRADIARRQLLPRRPGAGIPRRSDRRPAAPALAALVALRADDMAEASRNAAEAEAVRPRAPGDLKQAGTMRHSTTCATSTICCAGFFEVLTTTGKYFWIPTERVRVDRVSSTPKRPRDLLWRRVLRSR